MTFTLQECNVLINVLIVREPAGGGSDSLIVSLSDNSFFTVYTVLINVLIVGEAAGGGRLVTAPLSLSDNSFFTVYTKSNHSVHCSRDHILYFQWWQIRVISNLWFLQHVVDD